VVGQAVPAAMEATGEQILTRSLRRIPYQSRVMPEGVFKTWFYSSLSYSDLIGDKLN